MRHVPQSGNRFFFTTTPLPCPYLPDRVEQRIVTELVGRDANAFHNALSLSGFRRSHAIAYAPACPGCNACIPVRIRVADFVPSRSQKRVLSLNAEVTGHSRLPDTTEEQFALFERYLNSRHGDGDMANMTQADYRSLVEDTPIDTEIIEFREPDGSLIGACLADRLNDGLSAVYSFFNPDMAKRSLGTLIVLRLIEQALEFGLEYVYLGYWIEECGKMAYKTRFSPLEAYSPTGWIAFDAPSEPVEPVE